MRHVYVTLQHHDLVPELFAGDFDRVRGPFRFLLYEECLNWLLENGAGQVDPYWNDETRTRRAGLPFVPHLGGVRITPKALLEHRAIGHSYGQAVIPTTGLPSSPTGVRVVPRTEELVSGHRLADTYESPLSPEWDRRVASEGAADELFSEDQSTWHIPVSIEPRRRITVEAQTSEAALALGDAVIGARSYIHVYPYGGITTTLGLSFGFPSERSIGDVIALLRLVIRRPDPAEFLFQMRGFPSMSAQDLVRELTTRTVGAVVPEPKPKPYLHLNYAVSVSAEPDELSDGELSGLVQLDDRYQILKADWAESRVSLYGRYRGDRVLGTRGSLAVVTSPKHFSRSGHRRFFWRCHGLKEFASMQEMTVGAAARRLAQFGTADGPDEFETRRLQAIAEHLIEFPRGLPAHHRKWFYECHRLSGGVTAAESYYAALASMHEHARHTAILRGMENVQGMRITVKNSNIGTLNLGSILGDVESHLSVVTAPDATAARDALHKLAEAVANSEQLDDEQRKDLLQSIDLLAEEAAKPVERRRANVARSVLGDLATTLGAAGGLAEVWSTCGPAIVGLFS